MRKVRTLFKGLFSAVLKQDYIFSVISKFTGVFIAVVYSVFFNRYLGASLKGEAAIISNYTSILSSLICVGMYQAYPFYRRKEKDVFYPFLNNMTSLYFIIFALSLVFALFANTIDANIRVALVLVPIQAYIRHVNYVVTIENPRFRNKSSILINLSDLVIIIVLWAFTLATYKYLVFILILQTAVNLVLSYANLKVNFKHFRFTLSLIPKYAKFGFIPMITLFLMTLNYRVDILMLEGANEITTAQIGIYSVGVSISEKVWLIPDAVKDILLSRLCKDKGEEEVARTIRLNLVIAVVMVALVAVVSKPFVSLVYGEEYIGSDVITTIMLVGVIGMIFYKMVYSYNIFLGRRMINMIFLGSAAIINLVGNYILIPVAGIYGAALTSIVSYNICGICFLIYFHKSTQISYRKILFIQKEDLQLIKRFIKSQTEK